MKQYELLALAPGSLSDSEAEGVNQKLRALLEQHGASIVKQQLWDKRKLAYPIQHHKQGVYFLAQFDAEPSGIGKLDTAIRLEPSVLRHTITLYFPKSAKELERAARATAEERAEKMPAPKEAAPPISKEKLDEQLEKLLAEDVVE